MKAATLLRQVLLPLLLIWAVAGLILWQTRDEISWPARVAGLMQTAPWLADPKFADAAQRARHQQQTLRFYVMLDPGQRRKLREEYGEWLERYQSSLQEDELRLWANRSIDPLLAMLERALKPMPTEERKKLLGRLRGDVKGLRDASSQGERLNQQDQQLFEDLMNDDPLAMLRAAPPRVQLELAPVLEGLQGRLGGLRR